MPKINKNSFWKSPKCLRTNLTSFITIPYPYRAFGPIPKPCLTFHHFLNNHFLTFCDCPIFCCVNCKQMFFAKEMTQDSKNLPYLRRRRNAAFWIRQLIRWLLRSEFPFSFATCTRSCEGRWTDRPENEIRYS